MGQSSSQPAASLSQESEIKDEKSYNEGLIAADQCSLDNQLSSQIECANDSGDYSESTRLGQVGLTDLETRNTLESNTDKVNNTGFLHIMYESLTGSGGSKQKNRRRWKQRTSNTGQEDIPSSSQKVTQGNESLGQAKVVASETATLVGSSHDLQSEDHQPLNIADHRSKKRLKKAERRQKAKALYDKHGDLQSYSGTPSNAISHSSLSLAHYDTSPVAALHDLVVLDNHRKEKKKKAKRSKSHGQSSELEPFSPNQASLETASKAPGYLDSVVPDDNRHKLSSKQNHRKNAKDNVGLRKSDFDLDIRQHENADATDSTSSVLQTKDLTSRLPKKKNLSKSKLTVSEITQFNKDSQKFKSAKIKYNQNSNTNSARLLSDKTNRAPLNQNTTFTRSPTWSSDSGKAIGNANSTSPREESSDTDDESTSRSIQKLNTESAATSRNVYCVSDEPSQLEILSADDDPKTGTEADIAMESGSGDDNSSEGEDDKEDSADETRNTPYPISHQLSVRQSDRALQFSGRLSGQSTSTRKRNIEDDSNDDQPSKKLRKTKAANSRSRAHKVKSTKFILDSDNEESGSSTPLPRSVDKIENQSKKSCRLSVQQTISNSDTPIADKVKKLTKNYTVGSRKMGLFDNEELEIVRAFEIRYCAEHNLSTRQFTDKVHESAHNDKDKQALWTELVETLPGRDRKSVQRFLRRNRPSTGIVMAPFTKEDDQQLMSLVAKYDTSWVKIGQEMDRTADAVRDRYRNVLKDQATRNTSKWDASEIEDLKRAVGTTAAQALEHVSNVKDLSSLIVWSSVSQEMKGKRGRAQCAGKWNNLSANGKVSLVAEIRKAAERLNLRAGLSLIDNEDLSI